MMAVRKPAVAGQFYSASENLLKKELTSLTASGKKRINALGVVSPHAGYIYSGPVAGEVLASIEPKPTYIILGPNHTGFGRQFGLDLGRNWITPLGEVETDRELGEAIIGCSKHVVEDTLCHNYEHSIEVQLPFLQYLNKDFKFVPIVISYADKDVYSQIGKEIACTLKALKKNAMIIASSDMTHYESHNAAKKKDMMAIEKVLNLDVNGFLETVKKHDITMCGYAPTAIMMSACIELGAKKTELIKYNTSGDTSGDYSSVVGYAGIVIY